MKSPLVIIVELFFGLFNGAYQGIVFVTGKLGELFISLIFLSTFGILGFIIAVVIGAVVFVICTKFLMKSYKSLIIFGISFLVFLAVLVLFWMM